MTRLKLVISGGKIGHGTHHIDPKVKSIIAINIDPTIISFNVDTID